MIVTGKVVREEIFHVEIEDSVIRPDMTIAEAKDVLQALVEEASILPRDLYSSSEILDIIPISMDETISLEDF